MEQLEYIGHRPGRRKFWFGWTGYRGSWMYLNVETLDHVLKIAVIPPVMRYGMVWYYCPSIIIHLHCFWTCLACRYRALMDLLGAAGKETLSWSLGGCRLSRSRRGSGSGSDSMCTVSALYVAFWGSTCRTGHQVIWKAPGTIWRQRRNQMGSSPRTSSFQCCCLDLSMGLSELAAIEMYHDVMITASRESGDSSCLVVCMCCCLAICVQRIALHVTSCIELLLGQLMAFHAGVTATWFVDMLKRRGANMIWRAIWWWLVLLALTPSPKASWLRVCLRRVNLEVHCGIGSDLLLSRVQSTTQYSLITSNYHHAQKLQRLEDMGWNLENIFKHRMNSQTCEPRHTWLIVMVLLLALPCTVYWGDKSHIPLSGLIPGHAYTLLSAHEANGVRLLRLRNPWGDHEWTGDWSDKSPLEQLERIQTLKSYEIIWNLCRYHEW